MKMEGNCGSKTLMKCGVDAICTVCGYIIKDYKNKKNELGVKAYKIFERSIRKEK